MRTGQGVRHEIPDMTWFFQAGKEDRYFSRVENFYILNLGGTTVISRPCCVSNRDDFFCIESEKSR